MSSPAVTAPPAETGRRTRRRRAVSAPAVGRPGPLAIGVVTLWVSLIVLLPLAAVVVKSFEGGVWPEVPHYLQPAWPGDGEVPAGTRPWIRKRAE